MPAAPSRATEPATTIPIRVGRNSTSGFRINSIARAMGSERAEICPSTRTLCWTAIVPGASCEWASGGAERSRCQTNLRRNNCPGRALEADHDRSAAAGWEAAPIPATRSMRGKPGISASPSPAMTGRTEAALQSRRAGMTTAPILQPKAAASLCRRLAADQGHHQLPGHRPAGPATSMNCPVVCRRQLNRSAGWWKHRPALKSALKTDQLVRTLGPVRVATASRCCEYRNRMMRYSDSREAHNGLAGGDLSQQQPASGGGWARLVSADRCRWRWQLASIPAPVRRGPPVTNQ